MIGDINMPIIDKKELREIRKKKFALMEQQLNEIHPNEKNRLQNCAISCFVLDNDTTSEL